MFSLKCQPCGKEQPMEGKNPTSAIDLMHAAHVAGWLSYADNRHHGVVIFCSQKCCNAALTKDGFFRRDLGRGRVHRETEKN